MTQFETYMTIDDTKDYLREVKKMFNKLFKDGAISKQLKKYLMPIYAKDGSLRGHPKLYKKEICT